MKVKVLQRRGHRMSGNEQVRAEIQTFLQALASYADRVAREPKVTFQEHHGSLMLSASPTKLAAKAAAQGR
jgi:hypothetical protein